MSVAKSLREKQVLARVGLKKPVGRYDYRRNKARRALKRRRLMIRRLLLVVVASLTWLGVATVVAAPQSPAMTLPEIQRDFDFLRHALEEAHPGLYRYSTKAEMDRGFDAQRAKLTGPMPKLDFEVVIAETLALIRCGHTSMNPDDGFKAAVRDARTFPLRVKLDGPKLRVVLNDTPTDATILPGMELLEINGRKAGDIVNRFRQVLPADGDIETGKAHDISGRFHTYYWWLIERSDEFTVKARDDAGRLVVTKLAGVTDAQRKSNHNPVNEAMLAGVSKVMGWPAENAGLRFLRGSEIAEIRLKYFVGGDFPKWVEETFKTLREKGTTTLIIDLRGNGGGEDEYGAMLVGYLTDKPFRYFDHISMKTLSPSFKEHLSWSAKEEARIREGTIADPAGGYLLTPKMHTCLALQQPGKYPFLGKVFVLTEGGTFSTAADFCAVTHHLKRATFVGEETGGGYYGNNSGMMPTLTLPNSRVEIRLPMYEYWNAVRGYDGTRRGTIPDHVVELKTSDVLRGVDTQLDFALKLAMGREGRKDR